MTASHIPPPAPCVHNGRNIQLENDIFDNGGNEREGGGVMKGGLASS